MEEELSSYRGEVEEDDSKKGRRHIWHGWRQYLFGGPTAARGRPQPEVPGYSCVLLLLLFIMFCIGGLSGAGLVVWLFNIDDTPRNIPPKYEHIWGGNVNVTDTRELASDAMAVQVSDIAAAHPGRDDKHLHGILGLDADGNPGWSPQPINFRMTREQKTEAHRGYCFNSRVSDSISLDRNVPDFNDAVCNERRAEMKNLPAASVVIVFYNENLSVLLRSIHSVLNRTPPELLREIIIVDDFSDPETHPWLQQQLDDYLVLLPKTRIRRLYHRHGLMMARMSGVEWASGEVIVFLDSHIETAPNWIEPLLARIQEDRRNVVLPMIHTIGFDDFQFRGAGLTVLGFTWSLGQSFPNRAVSRADAAPSPIMAGGLFGINRSWFLELGGYDSEMRLYGGEEMEISFKIWQCGGRLDLLPCSRVGHVFRSSQYWVGQVYKVPGEEIHRNKLRAAEVWMDEFAEIAKLVIPKLPDGFEIGDMREQKAIRKKLQCKSFKWYLTEVFPEMFVPKIDLNSRVGAIENKKLNACVDTLGNTRTAVGAYPCHGGNGTQAYLLGPEGRLAVAQHGFMDCLMGDEETGTVQERSCKDEGALLKWTYDEGTGQMKSGENCMEVVRRNTPKSPHDLVFVKCKDGEPLQKFDFQKVKSLPGITGR
eukprot:GHVS01020261.1.p1 GENE.GHVS01020261.1~~GHVS01020261.1.p1  ORF type:complete len:650 (-),score=91.49 GHVS01020261.1:509-2458(-)